MITAILQLNTAEVYAYSGLLLSLISTVILFGCLYGGKE